MSGPLSVAYCALACAADELSRRPADGSGWWPAGTRRGDELPAAWRVVIARRHRREALPLAFGRRRDAELAAAALAGAGLTSWLALRRAGPAVVRRLIAESLQW